MDMDNAVAVWFTLNSAVHWFCPCKRADFSQTYNKYLETNWKDHRENLLWIRENMGYLKMKFECSPCYNINSILNSPLCESTGSLGDVIYNHKRKPIHRLIHSGPLSISLTRWRQHGQWWATDDQLACLSEYWTNDFGTVLYFTYFSWTEHVLVVHV